MTAEELFDKIHDIESIYFLTNYSMGGFHIARRKVIDALTEHDKEWEEKIIEARMEQDIINEKNILLNQDAAITQTKAEIRDKIEEMIKESKAIYDNDFEGYKDEKLKEDRRLYWSGKIKALTELLTFIKEK